MDKFKILAVVALVAGIIAFKPARHKETAWTPEYSATATSEKMFLSRVERNRDTETLTLYGVNGESKVFDFDGLTFRIENDCPEETTPFATIEISPLVNGNDRTDVATSKVKVIIHTNLSSSKAGFQAGYTVSFNSEP